MAGYLRTRVAYLQGLAEGLDISNDSPQGRILTELLDVLDDVAGAVEGIERRTDELSEFVDAVDEDLETLEDEVCEPVFVAEEDDEEDGDGLTISELRCPECQQTLVMEGGVTDRN